MIPKPVGLVGCGKVASYGHVPAILQCEGLELTALYDPLENNLEKVRKCCPNAKGFTNLEDFFRCGIEAVTITSPAPCHYENVLDCARNAIPVLCEKPLAMNQPEGEEMIRAMREAGASFYAAFCYRFSPCALKIRELVQSGAIGNVRTLRLIYNWNLHGKYQTNARGEKILNARREGRMEEGGPMVDCGTHQIDLAHFWLNSPVVRHHAHGSWVEEHEAPDHLWLHMDHASGAHTVVEISYSYAHTAKNPRSEFVYELIGSEGLIRYDREAESFFAETVEGHQQFDFFEEKDFAGLYAEWARALAQGSSSLLPTAEHGLQVAALARNATEEVIRSRFAAPSTLAKEKNSSF